MWARRVVRDRSSIPEVSRARLRKRMRNTRDLTENITLHRPIMRIPIVARPMLLDVAGKATMDARGRYPGRTQMAQQPPPSNQVNTQDGIVIASYPFTPSGAHSTSTTVVTRRGSGMTRHLYAFLTFSLVIAFGILAISPRRQRQADAAAAAAANAASLSAPSTITTTHAPAVVPPVAQPAADLTPAAPPAASTSATPVAPVAKKAPTRAPKAAPKKTAAPTRRE